MEELTLVFENNLEEVDIEYHHADRCDVICEICGKHIKYKHKRHMLSHSVDKPYECHLCNKRFRLPVVLKSHLKTHENVKPHQCKICGNCFVRPSVLRSHLLIHSGEKPYQCELCFSCFTQRSVLIRHLATHSDQKFYNCKLCNRKFRRKFSLEIHNQSKRHKLRVRIQLEDEKLTSNDAKEQPPILCVISAE